MASGKKWYYVFWMHQENFKRQSTEKAFYASYLSGHWGSGHDKPIWFPKSQCRFEEPNEVGNFRVFIPCWLIDNNPTLDKLRIDLVYEGRVQL